jgi:hypothetical protein
MQIYSFQINSYLWGRQEAGKLVISSWWMVVVLLGGRVDTSRKLVLCVVSVQSDMFCSDGVDGKPWADKVNGSAKAFSQARNSWEPTWGQGDARGMMVKKVSMWRVC